MPMTDLEQIVNALLRRASEACYWKEDFEDKGYPESAEHWKIVEQIWLEAIAIVKGERT